MKTTDKLMAPTRGSAQTALDFFSRVSGVYNRADVVLYVNEVYRIAPLVGIDASIVVAHGSHETNYFRSDWWRYRKNPAGMGVTGDPQQNSESPRFATGVEAARAHVAHYVLYATGTIKSPLSSADDPRYAAYIEEYGNVVKATTIEGLTNTWAWDDDFHEGVVRQGNEIFPNLPDQADIVEVGPQPSPIFYQGKPWTGLTNIRVNGILFRAQRREVHVNVDTLNVRQYADTTSEVIRTLTFGSSIQVIGYVVGEKVGNENRWWIGQDYGRIWVGGTSEKPR
jgi:hypothetical protein